MDINDIKSQYVDLNLQLINALSTMDLSDKVINIRKSMKELQNICPHTDGIHNFALEYKCPYCGRIFD